MPRKKMSNEVSDKASTKRIHVLAYERGRTVWFSSLNMVIGSYGVASIHKLKVLIESGATAPDGYTTFDYAIEGYPYEGMKDRDYERLVDDKFKEF